MNLYFTVFTLHSLCLPIFRRVLGYLCLKLKNQKNHKNHKNKKKSNLKTIGFFHPWWKPINLVFERTLTFLLISID